MYGRFGGTWSANSDLSAIGDEEVLIGNRQIKKMRSYLNTSRLIDTA
jgi:hypothetical protein